MRCHIPLALSFKRQRQPELPELGANLVNIGSYIETFSQKMTKTKKLVKLAALSYTARPRSKLGKW